MTDPQDNRSVWEPLLASLAERRAAAQSMGGAEKLARYRAAGGIDARERIRRLVDADAFEELGVLAGDDDVPADAFIAGAGRVDGRPVLVGAEDFTVAGGSIGIAAATKRARLAELAAGRGVPLIMMLEGAGHRPTNGLRAQRPAPNDLQLLADLAGAVPMVAVVTGPSAGHGALAAPLSDFTVMVRDRGALFTAGPPLVRAATGEQVTKEQLGGPAVHAEASGMVHNVADDVDEALRMVRRYLSYFPSNSNGVSGGSGDCLCGSGSDADTGADPDCGPRRLDALLAVIPPDARRPYDMTEVLTELMDRGSVMEIQPGYGASMITALARFGGRAVAVIANQPMVLAGAIDCAAADKAARFVGTASAFGLPLLQLADTPGVLSGSASEKAGILRAASRMFVAQHRHPGPKLHVTLRKAFGFGSSVMGQNAFGGQTLSLALPGATLGGIPAAVGGATSKSDDETRRALEDNESSGPWRLAGTATYDDVIDPRELRNALLGGLRAGRNGGAE